MKRKTIYMLSMTAMTAAMFMINNPVFASEVDDRKIETAFKNSYTYTTYLSKDSIKIEAKDGVVRLTGTVAGEYHKALAQNTASGLIGVNRVENDMQTAAEVAADNADKRIGRNVNLALLFHRNVNAGKTVIEVKDRIVTLKGVASSEAQKELTSEYAKDVEDVIEVRNLMTVAAVPEPADRSEGVKLDDASITAQVKTALLVHRSTSSVSTKVTTLNGEVKLTGIAKNAAEKSLVTKLVSDIHGVTKVMNEMTVEDIATK